MRHSTLDFYRGQRAKELGITLQEYKESLERTNREFKEYLKIRNLNNF